MENYKLVLPEHLNHYGFLFGGHMLHWVDEFAYIAATLDFPDSNLVTVAMDKVEFRRGVKLGSILKFEATQSRKGRTSVQYEVSVFRAKSEITPQDILFSTHVTYVNVDPQGIKCPLP